MFLAADTDATLDPTPKLLGDMITARQLELIRRCARRAEVDAERECRAYFNCQPEDLSRRAASAFIEHLSRVVAEAVARRDAV